MTPFLAGSEEIQPRIQCDGFGITRCIDETEFASAVPGINRGYFRWIGGCRKLGYFDAHWLLLNDQSLFALRITCEMRVDLATVDRYDFKQIFGINRTDFGQVYCVFIRVTGINVDFFVCDLDDVAGDDVTVFHNQLIGERRARQESETNNKQGQPVSQVMEKHSFSPGKYELICALWNPVQETQPAII